MRRPNLLLPALAAMALTTAAAPAAPADGALDFGGLSLIGGQGQAVPSERLDGKYVALYFSASWCPPCRHFTPILTEAYEAWRKEKKPIEVVLVPFDRTADAAQAYLGKMPWIGLAFDSDRVQQLARQYGVSGIPSLVVLNPRGEVVSLRGREEVSRDPSQAFETWQKADTAAVDGLRVTGRADGVPGRVRRSGSVR